MGIIRDKKRKVLWLSHVVPFPPRGGLLQRSFNLVAELAKQHDVFVVAFNQEDVLEGALPEQDDPLGYAVNELSKFLNGIRVIRIPFASCPARKLAVAVNAVFSPRGYSVDWLRSREFGQTIIDVKEEFSPDVVIFDTISLSLYQPLLDGVPSILDHHNIESSMMMERVKRERNFIKKIYFWQESIKLKRFESVNCKKHSTNITCSDVEKEKLIRLYGIDQADVTSIPNGVDVDFFQPLGCKKIAKSLVFAGGLSWYPNLDAMRFFKNEIWPKLTIREPDVVMTLVGRNPPAEFYSLKDKRFKVTGFVDDVRPYLSSALCYICPIRDGGGTKLKILDALAMGSVIVAHPFACSGIDVIPEEHVLFAESADEFVEQILRVFGDKNLRIRLSTNARKLAVEKYSFEKIGAQLAGIVSGLG